MNFDVTPLWLICISVCAPIAAVVGFAVQLRSVKNLRLENKKLELEIEELEKAKEEAERRIVIATTEEVKEYNDISFSRRPTQDAAPTRKLTIFSKLGLFKAALQEYAIFFFICVFVFYLIFDAYRVTLWLWSLF